MAITRLCMYIRMHVIMSTYRCLYCTPQFIACVELIHIDLLQHHYYVFILVRTGKSPDKWVEKTQKK